MLGVSQRSLERRAANGYIGRKVGARDPHSPSAPVFYSRGDIAALLAGTPNRHAVVQVKPQKAVSNDAGESTALAVRPNDALDPFAGLAAHLARLAAAFPAPAPLPKPWLTLAEAVEYSGLPVWFLVDRARSGGIRAVNVGHGTREYWRFHREGLGK